MPAATALDSGQLRLVRPDAAHLGGYVDALRRGWSADTVRGAAAAAEELQSIERDPAVFLAQLDDPLGLGPPVTLPDGTQRPRLPSVRRWLWDDEGFAGSIGLRWAPGGAPLPPHVLGHVGYAVVPWKQRRGYATGALAAMLPLARAQGLRRLVVTTDPDNVASQRVILANGGVLLERFDKGAAYGHQPGLRYVIDLGPAVDTAGDGWQFSSHDGALPPELAQAVDAGLGAANSAAAPLHEVLALGCFVRDAAGAVCGGAVGRCWGRVCELQQLWVDTAHRGRGLGGELVRRFEVLARDKGCNRVYLETFSFQAPRLYRALGYAPVHVNAHFPHGIVKQLMEHGLEAPDGSRPPKAGTRARAQAPIRVHPVQPEEAADPALRPALVEALATLLHDAVHGGASVGFLLPLPMHEAREWARDTLAALGPGLLLWLAERDGRAVGTVQLGPCLKPNGRHRGEVMKLLVHQQARGHGVARALMGTLEQQARALGLRLLVLDTLSGSPAVAIYRHLGWQEAGQIPGYAGTPAGELHATVVMHKTI